MLPNSPTELLGRVASKIATIGNVVRRRNLTGCTEILAGLRFEKDLIRQLFREEIMRESVIYQDILERGTQIGEQRKALSLVLLQLDRRLGGIDPELSDRLRALSVEKLEALAVALLDFSTTEDLIAWLEERE